MKKNETNCPCCGQVVKNDFAAEVEKSIEQEAVRSVFERFIDYEINFLINFVKRNVGHAEGRISVETLKDCNRHFLANQLDRYKFETQVGRSVAGIVISKLKQF